MFGKNYDEEIKLCDKNIGALSNSIKGLQELFESMQENIITLGIVQNQHKSIISFLLNHATVSPDAQEDLGKMMQEVVRVEKDIKKKLGKKK